MLQLNGLLSSLSRDAFDLLNITPIKQIVCVEIVLPFDRKAYTILLETCQSLARNKVYVLFFFLFVFDCSVSANGVCECVFPFVVVVRLLRMAKMFCFHCEWTEQNACQYATISQR